MLSNKTKELTGYAQHWIVHKPEVFSLGPSWDCSSMAVSGEEDHNHQLGDWLSNVRNFGSRKRTCSVVHFVHPNSCTEGMWMSLCNYKWVCLKHCGFLSSSLWFNCSVTTTWGVQSLRQPSLPHGASNTVQVNKTLADELWLLLMQQFKALLLCQSE